MSNPLGTVQYTDSVTTQHTTV